MNGATLANIGALVTAGLLVFVVMSFVRSRREVPKGIQIAKGRVRWSRANRGRYRPYVQFQIEGLSTEFRYDGAEAERVATALQHQDVRVSYTTDSRWNLLGYVVEIRCGDEFILSREAGLDGLRYQQFWTFYMLVVVLGTATLVLFVIGHAG